MHRLHVHATVALTHAAMSNLIPRARAGTGVINVSSVAAFLPAATYGATKTWINAFTESLANELRVLKSPLTVQALCPGFTVSWIHAYRIPRRDGARPFGDSFVAVDASGLCGIGISARF
jgi:short-subunit dehydrogenase